MKVLLDTHVFLWWIADDHRLSGRARELMADNDATLLFSAVSGWEIAIKAGLGRIHVEGDLSEFVVGQLTRNSIDTLSIEMRHTLHLHSLPAHHRDPFDRLLISQAQVEGLPIVTSDGQISRYDVDIIW